MSNIILTVAIIISAVLHMWAEYNGPPLQIYIFKPLTTSLIITLSTLAKPPISKRYKTLVLVGLLFSLSGDILLMLPFDLFVFGLISFLIAHLVYIAAFQAKRPWRISWIPALLLIAFGVTIYLVLAPGLGDMTIPVIFYIVVILTMAYSAWDQWDQHKERWAMLAFIGALLFVLSDSILAINKFRHPFLAGRGMNLSFYFAAQWFIARSIEKNYHS
ncbi:MAG: lysoplasmalogenase [Anaerolineales bacterium]|nr:lysoplasmalogenase [Chloroflexota bacterium]MBL6981869.1 lysoplasmalogenase [Anaerolineales bacterium]